MKLTFLVGRDKHAVMRAKSGTWRERLNPQVHTVWCGAWRRGVLEAPRMLSDHELVLVTRGVCDMEVGGERLVCRAPYFLIVPPLTRHLSVAATATRRICVHFDWDGRCPVAPDALYHFLPERPRPAAVRPAPDWAPPPMQSGVVRPGGTELALAESLADRWLSDDPLARATARALLLELLLRLLSPSRPPPSADSGRRTRLALEIKHRLDFFELTSGSLRRELDDLGYRYEYLCRVFTRAFGMSPGRYRQQVRLEKARRRLTAGGVAVKQAAAELGFRDAAHFCRVFKRHIGQSPGAYARAMRPG